MTLVAGFKCRGGVVLCADSQEHAQDLKFWVDKLFYYNEEWCQAGFGGSGPGWLVDRLLERIGEELDKRHDTIAAVRGSIRRALQDVYKKEVKLHPDDEKEKQAELLIAVRPKSEQQVTMFHTDGPVMHEVFGSGYQIVGVGEAAGYIAQNLYKADLSINAGVILGTYVTGHAKKYIDSVAGNTQILVVTDVGRIEYERVEASERKEKLFEDFNEALKELILLLPDTSQWEDYVTFNVNAFANRIKELRAQYLAKESEEHTLRALGPGKHPPEVYSRFPQGYGHPITDRIQALMKGMRADDENGESNGGEESSE